MLTWMIYALSISVIVGVAAFVAEMLARQRRSPSRGYWLLAIVASLAIPTAMTSVSVETPEIFRPILQQNVIALSQVTSPQLSPTKWVESRASVATEFRSHDS